MCWSVCVCVSIRRWKQWTATGTLAFTWMTDVTGGPRVMLWTGREWADSTLSESSSEIFYQPVVLIEDLHHHHERYCYCLLLSTTNNPSHPLQSTLLKQGSSSSLKLIQPHVHKECLRKSFLLFSWVYTVHTIFFNDICTTLHLY